MPTGSSRGWAGLPLRRTRSFESTRSIAGVPFGLPARPRSARYSSATLKRPDRNSMLGSTRYLYRSVPTARSASSENRALRCSSRAGKPPAGNENASNAWPRTGRGRSSTSESVRTLPIPDRAAMACRRLVFPAPFGPNSTARRGTSTVTSTSDLKLRTVSFVSIAVSVSGSDTHRRAASRRDGGRSRVGDPGASCRPAHPYPFLAHRYLLASRLRCCRVSSPPPRVE